MLFADVFNPFHSGQLPNRYTALLSEAAKLVVWKHCSELTIENFNIIHQFFCN